MLSPVFYSASAVMLLPRGDGRGPCVQQCARCGVAAKDILGGLVVF